MIGRLLRKLDRKGSNLGPRTKRKGEEKSILKEKEEKERGFLR